MKAARLHAFGDVDQIHYDDIPVPVPGAGEVLVKIEASSLNPVELYVRQGYLEKMVPLALPAIMGLDLAGTVIETGAGVVGYKAGDRVIGKLPIGSNGANAEFQVVPENRLARLADNVDFLAGATLPLAGLTGRQAVVATGAKAGDRILVTGALGAVGRAAIQYLKELGAVPIAGVRAAQISEVEASGIEALAIGETDENAIFDGAVVTVGGPLVNAAIDLVRDGGTVASVVTNPEGANADGRVILTHLFTVDDGPTLQAVADAAARGDLHIPIAKILPLSQVGEGHRLLAAGQVGGKIIFTP